MVKLFTTVYSLTAEYYKNKLLTSNIFLVYIILMTFYYITAVDMTFKNQHDYIIHGKDYKVLLKVSSTKSESNFFDDQSCPLWMDIWAVPKFR